MANKVNYVLLNRHLRVYPPLLVVNLLSLSSGLFITISKKSRGFFTPKRASPASSTRQKKLTCAPLHGHGCFCWPPAPYIHMVRTILVFLGRNSLLVTLPGNAQACTLFIHNHTCVTLCWWGPEQLVKFVVALASVTYVPDLVFPPKSWLCFCHFFKLLLWMSKLWSFTGHLHGYSLLFLQAWFWQWNY